MTPEDLGTKIAIDNAKRELWTLLAFSLADTRLKEIKHETD